MLVRSQLSVLVAAVAFATGCASRPDAALGESEDAAVAVIPATGSSPVPDAPDASDEPGDAPATIALLPVEPLFVAGMETSGTVPVEIVRHGYQGSVAITLEGLPPDLNMRGVTIAHHEVAATLYASSLSLPRTVWATVRATPAAKSVAAVTAPIRIDIGAKPGGGFGSFDLRAPDGRSWFPTSQHGRPVSLTTNAHRDAVLLTTSCELGLYDVATDAPVSSFGVNGVAVVTGMTRCSRKPVEQADGAFLVRGAMDDTVFGPERIVRVGASGHVDATFGTNGHLDVAAHSHITNDAGGRMAIASGANVHRYDANGHASPSGTLVLPWTAEAIAVLPDGAILAAYTAELVDECRGLSLFRTNGDGTPDETFAPAGLLELGCNEIGPVETIHTLPSGAIVLQTSVYRDTETHYLAVRTVTRDAGGVWSLTSSSAPEDVSFFDEPGGTVLRFEAWYSLNWMVYAFERTFPAGGPPRKGTIIVPWDGPSLAGFAPGPSHGLMAATYLDAPVLVRIRLD